MRIRTLLFAAAAALSLPGCVFPLVATGVGGAALVAEDRRTAGTMLDDQRIEVKAANLLQDQYGRRTHVSVTSYNRNALLTGEAQSAEAKDAIAGLIRSIDNVRSVVNEIVISEAPNFTARSQDALLTSRVKARFVTEGTQRFQVNHVKVVSENGIVYLLGLVTRDEANAATEIARSTTGVRKVVKVFEYLDAPSGTADASTGPASQAPVQTAR